MSNIRKFYEASGISLPAVTYEDCCTYFSKFTLESYEDYDKVLDNFKTKFVFNSNHISGIFVDLYVTRAVLHGDDIPGYAGKFDNLIAIANFNELFNLMYENLVSRRQLWFTMVTDYHTVLMDRLIKPTENEYRKDNNPPEHFENISDFNDILILLQESIKSARYNDKDSVDESIRKAIETVISLERIRPFSDGNGRVARVMMNYILLLNGLPPAVIFNKDALEYFDLIRNYSIDKKNIGIDFVKKCTITTWENEINGGL